MSYHLVKYTLPQKKRLDQHSRKLLLSTHLKVLKVAKQQWKVTNADKFVMAKLLHYRPYTFS